MRPSAMNSLLGCARDTETQHRLEEWIQAHVVELGQQITVSAQEVIYAGDQHEGLIERRRQQAYRNMSEMIRKSSCAEIESKKSFGRFEERHYLLIVKP